MKIKVEGDSKNISAIYDIVIDKKTLDIRNIFVRQVEVDGEIINADEKLLDKVEDACIEHYYQNR